MTRRVKIGLFALVLLQSLVTLAVYFARRPAPVPVVAKNDVCNPCTVSKHWDAASEACAYDPPVRTVVTHGPTDASGTYNFTILRKDVDKSLGNLNELVTQARIVPSFKDGATNGFKIFGIRPGSIYHQVGLQNGDIVTHVNGQMLNSWDKAVEIYEEQMRTKSSNPQIRFERGGITLTYIYEAT